LGGLILEGSNPNRGTQAGPGAAQTPESGLGAGYLDLMELVQGHPLALQIVLPLLKDVPASVVSGELLGRIAALQEGDQEEARPDFLTAAMDYSFSRMPRRTRTHLPFLSLFQRRVMLDILTHITQERPYRNVMGEELGWGACRTLLRSARDAGFIEMVTPSVYQINPAFPWFYGRSLHRQARAAGVGQLEQEFVRVYADTADYFLETLHENQDAGATAVLLEEGNLTQALGLALEGRQWEPAQILIQPLAQVYQMQKRYPELRRLRRQVLQAVAPGEGSAQESQEQGAIELWLYLQGTEANEATELGDLERSEEINRDLLEYLESQESGHEDPRTASVCHQFGVIALRRWQVDQAEEWFQRSLAIIEAGEDRESVADDYHCLGQVCQRQRRYADAKVWFGKSLEIHQRSGDQEEMVNDYRALGSATQFKFEYEEAESWYQRARAILEENRDEETALLVYHELGTVYHARFMYEEAERWYKQALTLSDQLGKAGQMAHEFHYLGLMEQGRGMFFDDAENWFELALEKREELGDRKGAGDEHRQLGVLHHEQKKLDQAEGCYRRALDIFEEIGDLQRVSRTLGQLAMVEEDRGNLAEALSWAHRTYELAIEHQLPVLTQVKSHLARLRDKFGEAEFNQWWRGSTGGEPPTGLDVDTSTIL
jgi:tetratricopeptide (TPR) repeat protein